MADFATFIAQDDATSGNWVGVYGLAGYYKLEGGTTFGSNGDLVSSLPANVSVTDPYYTRYNSASETSDPRGVRRSPPNQGFRDASAFYGKTLHRFTVSSSDSATRRVRILLMDWENAGRSTRVDIVEAANPSNVLDTRTVPAGAAHVAGVWLSWGFAGTIQVRCTCLAGPNSTSYMLAFDDATPADVAAPKVTAASVDSAGTTLTVTFSESVTGGTGFTLSGGHTLGTAAGSGTSRTFSITPTVLLSETVTLSYVPGNVADAAKNALASFLGSSVSNNSTLMASISAGTATESKTAITVDVAASVASGGTGSITYQWYGSTTSGFTPGAGTLIAEQTAQNLTAFAVSAGTTWYFLRKATDSARTPAIAFTPQFIYTAPGAAGKISSYSRGRLANG